MIVEIEFKSSNPTKKVIYDIPQSDVARLRIDFSQHQRNGNPTEGVYSCHTGSSNNYKSLAIIFADITAINFI